MTLELEGHTHKRFDGELVNLHLKVLEMGGLAADQLRLALSVIKDKNLHLAHKVITRDIEVDELEVKVDEEIVSVLARRNPMARDLRAVISFSKIISDLERIGDEAVKISSLALQMYDNDGADPAASMLRDIVTMGRLVSAMLEDSLKVFDRLDAQHALDIVSGHTELEAEFQSSVRRLATFLMEDARNVGYIIKVVLITKALERIGDHSKNIAEYVIYLINGKDVRHHQWSNGGPPPTIPASDDDFSGEDLGETGDADPS